MLSLIGNTPAIKIHYRYQQKDYSVIVKLESYNLTGSIKDRIIDYILKESIKDGSLKEGMTLVEATSGNTGIAVSALGQKYHYPVHIYMPNWMSKERVELMRLYGAKVTLISKEEGGFLECIKRAKEEPNAFLINQFENIRNVEAHYFQTGQEFVDLNIKIDGFVSGIGTGGTLMGIGQKLKEIYQSKIIALEPKQMSLLKLNTKGDHLIEGIGDEFVPKIVNPYMIDDIVVVDDKDAVNMSRLLSKKLGLGVGISSGANFLGSVMARNYGTIATVFADDNKKYLSTTLSQPIDLNPDFLSNQIELIDYELII